MTSISCVREELQAKREIYNTQDKVEAIISNVMETGGQQQQSRQQRGKRKRFITSRLEDFLVTDRLPGQTEDRLRRVAILCIDLMEEEFSQRFSRENTQLWASMECLLPSSPKFMDIKQLEPFYEYCVSIPVARHHLLSQELMKADFEAECRIYRRIISKQDRKIFQHQTRKTIDMNKLCTYIMKEHASNAPILTMLYRVATTAGYASARVEGLFSALTKIDAPQRRSMTTTRESELIFLHFEQQTLMSVTFKEFLDIWRQKPRKLTF